MLFVKESKDYLAIIIKLNTKLKLKKKNQALKSIDSNLLCTRKVCLLKIFYVYLLNKRLNYVSITF